MKFRYAGCLSGGKLLLKNRPIWSKLAYPPEILLNVNITGTHFTGVAFVVSLTCVSFACPLKISKDFQHCYSGLVLFDSASCSLSRGPLTVMWGMKDTEESQG